jgi:hypothetical protein
MLFRRSCALLASPTHILLLPLHLPLPRSRLQKCTNCSFRTIYTYSTPGHPPISFKPTSQYGTCKSSQEVPSSADPDALIEKGGCAQSLTGDIRSLFEVLRGAIDLAVAPSTIRNSVDENPFNTPNATVTPQHILAALKAYTPAAPKAPTTNSIAPRPTLPPQRVTVKP